MSSMERGRLYDRAMQQLRQGQAAAAIESLRQILALDPDDAEAHALLALCLLDMKRLPAAVHEASLALSLEPESSVVLFTQARVAIANRQPREAEEALDRLQALTPYNAEIYRTLAIVRQLQGKAPEAVELLEKARQLDPQDPDILTDLGSLLLDRGEKERAMDLAHRALALEPEHGDALVLMGHLLLDQGDTDGAREHAIWALRHDATDAGALRLLAAVKGRRSLWAGLWWRYATWMGRLGETGQIIVLLGAFVLYRIGLTAARQAGNADLSGWVQMIWLAIVAYTWIVPTILQSSLRRELANVELKDEF